MSQYYGELDKRLADGYWNECWWLRSVGMQKYDGCEDERIGFTMPEGHRIFYNPSTSGYVFSMSRVVLGFTI